MEVFADILAWFGAWSLTGLRGVIVKETPIGTIDEIWKGIGVKESKEDFKIKIVEPKFDASQLNEISTIKSQIFRPQVLADYVGQEKAKNLIGLNIKKIKEIKKVHILISGRRGCGKTSLAHIIANQLNARCLERISSQIKDEEDVINIINEINSYEGLTVLFLDEVHALGSKRGIAELFYPIMEDYQIMGKQVKPFILIGATTEKNILVNKLSPLVDRFQVQIELENYSLKDLVILQKQYKAKMYDNYSISNEQYQIIAENCKFCPRIAIVLLEDLLIEPDLTKVLEYHNIVENGLTTVDIAILQALERIKKPIGEDALAQITSISRADYRAVYEPFLAEQGYLVRTGRGRILGARGIELLQRSLNG